MEDKKPNHDQITAHDEATRHMNEALKHGEIARKFKEKIKARKELDKNFSPSEEAQLKLDETKSRNKHHVDQYKLLAQKLQAFNKDKVEKGGDGSGQVGHKTVQQQKEAATHHFDRAAAYADAHERMKDAVAKKKKENPDFKVPKEAQAVLDNVESKRSEHSASFKDNHRPGDSNWKFKKSIMGVYDQHNSTAIGTSDYAIAEEAAQDWLPLFRDIMSDFQVGDQPRTVVLSNGHSILLAKVEDGLYSGFVSKSKMIEGQEMVDNLAKVEQQTLADIIQYLKAKEYITAEIRLPEPIVPVVSSIVQQSPVESSLERKIKALEILERIINGL